MGLTKVDLEEFVGKEVYSIMYAELEESNELDYGTIVKVTESGLHLDTSRTIQVYDWDTEKFKDSEEEEPLTLIIPLANILNIEISREELK